MTNFVSKSLLAALVGGMLTTGCGTGVEAVDDEAAAGQALQVGTAPAVATIKDGVGAAGVSLGMTLSAVSSVLGTAVCVPVVATRNQTCTWASADGVVRARGTFNTASPRQLTTLAAPFGNATWTSTLGIHVGSTTGALNTAYGASIDASRSSSYSKAVPGVDPAGAPTVTRFTLGWFNEYQPNQYFGVTDITVGRL